MSDFLWQFVKTIELLISIWYALKIQKQVINNIVICRADCTLNLTKVFTGIRPSSANFSNKGFLVVVDPAIGGTFLYVSNQSSQARITNLTLT